MNKQVRTLAKSAGMKECALGYGMPENVLRGERNIERFAELIVKECAKVADKGYASDNFGNGITGTQLLKHFGVGK